MIFALSGTVVAQLFVLNHKPNPNPTFGFHVLGKPLAVTLISFSIAFSILGWWRWFNWQRNTIRGIVVVGGGEIEGVGFLMMLVCGAPFISISMWVRWFMGFCGCCINHETRSPVQLDPGESDCGRKVIF